MIWITDHQIPVLQRRFSMLCFVFLCLPSCPLWLAFWQGRPANGLNCAN